MGLFLLASFVYFGRADVNIVSGGDTWGYYGYLPSLFIYGDLKNPEETYLARFNYTFQTPRLPEKQGEFTPTENGNNVIKYTSGVAMLQLPFFAVGHAIAALLPGVPADGYSWPYRWLINLSVIFYYLLAVGWLFKVLVREVNPRVAAATIVLLTVGSNLFNFLVFRGPMAHGYLFSLYALLLWSTVRFYAGPNFKSALGIGISAGLITLIRPVEMICLLIPLLYGLSSMRTLRERVPFWLKHYRPLLAAIGAYAIVGFLHLAYWKYVSGHWLFFSYGEEGFDWKNPMIYEGFFDYKNGWLRYSPLLWVALVGILRLLVKRDWLWPVLTFLPLHIYITYAWWNWYYINGFGSRPMVETYALLAIPFAHLLAWSESRKILRYGLIALVTACVGLNLFQHEQHVRGVLWPESGNKAYYWSVFGKLKTDYNALVAYVSDTYQPDTNDLVNPRLLYRNDFENPALDTFIQDSIVAAGQYALAVPESRKYTDFFKGRLGDFLDLHRSDGPGGQPAYVIELRVTARKEVTERPWYSTPGIVFEGEWKEAWRSIRIDPLLGNGNFNTFSNGKSGVWDQIRYFYPIPAHAKSNHLLKVYLSNKRQVTYLDDLELYVWQRK